MATLNTALTRLGVGGASINYTRPFADKVAAIATATFIGVKATFALGALVGKSIGWIDVPLPVGAAWVDIDTTTTNAYTKV